MRALLVFALLFFAFCLVSVATADVVYVDCNAPGPMHDGTSWDTAFLTIQEGVDAATPDGDVWVADGTYVENVVMGEGVAIYGGFLGAEEGGYEDSLDQRDFVNNVATIDGNQSGSCVVLAVGARVDGFTITNGSGTPESNGTCGGGVYCKDLGDGGAVANNVITANAAEWEGGGICCKHSSPLVEGNRITDNSALEYYSYGGGICFVYSSPTITGNTITGNVSDYQGGGIYGVGNTAASISGNVIAGSSARQGGGICCEYQCSPTIERNVLTDNDASYGGAIYCHDGSEAVIAGNLVEGNSGGTGGGIHCEKASPRISGNRVVGNSAHHGGGIYCRYCNSTVDGNHLEDNAAEFDGGGLYVTSLSVLTAVRNSVAGNSARGEGGGIYVGDDCELTIEGNVITGNSARSGGGIWCGPPETTVARNVISGNSALSCGGGVYFDHGQPVLVCNTITGNTADEYGGGVEWVASSSTASDNVIALNSAGISGGGASCANSAVTLTNGTIASNWSVNGCGINCYSGVHQTNLVVTNCILWNGGDEIWRDEGSEIAVAFSDVQGGWPGEGNIDADPVFADPEDGDFHLTSKSPCIDAGCNDYVVTDEDIDGDPRIIWAMRFPVPYWPHPGYVDMGADEFVPGLRLRRGLPGSQ